MATHKPWTAGLVIAALAVAALFIALRFSQGLPLDTNILKALPLAGHDAVVADAIARAEAAAGRQITLAFRGKDSVVRETAARDLERRLRETGFFAPRVEQGGDIARWLFANRHEILCPADRAVLVAGEGGLIARDAVAAALLLGSPVSGGIIAQDPFLLAYRLTRCLLPSSPAVVGGTTIISGQLNTSPYWLTVQDAMDRAIDDWRRDWSDRGISLDRAGAVFYAQAAGAQARSEVSFIGGVGTVGVVVLFWLIFGRMYAPALAAATMAAGVLVGFAVCLALFQTISVLTLVFGAALIGITVDYAVHYLMTAFVDRTEIGTPRLGCVLRPLTVGMATSVCGFLSLILFVSPVMTEIAVFAAVGLVSSWAFSIAVLPLIDHQHRAPGRAALGMARFAEVLIGSGGGVSRGYLGGAAIVGLLVMVGFSRLTILDDIRGFQERPADLRTEEQRVKEIAGFQPRVQFLLSRGATANVAKQNEEAALALMEEHNAPSIRSVVLAATRFDPSKDRRHDDRNLLRAGLFEPAAVDQARRFGLDPDALRGQIDRDESPVGFPAALAALIGNVADEHYLIAPLTGGEAERLAAQQAALPEGSQIVDPAVRYTMVLKEYRELSVIAFALAAAANAAAVGLVYRRWAALRIILPPVLAGVVTCAVLGLVGVPFSFFAGVALLVALGVGIDFAVFQYDRAQSQQRWLLAAICLAAITSALTMGLLGLSRTLPVSTFGLTVGVGVLMNMLFSRLARPPVRGDRRPGLNEGGGT